MLNACIALSLLIHAHDSDLCIKSDKNAQPTWFPWLTYKQKAKLQFLQTVKGLLLVFGGVVSQELLPVPFELSAGETRRGQNSKWPSGSWGHKGIIHLSISSWVAHWCLTQSAVFYGTCPQAHHFTPGTMTQEKVPCGSPKGSSACFLNPAGSTIEPLFRSK